MLRPVSVITSTPNNADCDRIVRAFRERGMALDRAQARELWRLFSDGGCAGWLILPPDDERLMRCLEDLYVTCPV